MHPDPGPAANEKGRRFCRSTLDRRGPLKRGKGRCSKAGHKARRSRHPSPNPMKKLSAIEIDELAERLQEIDAEADAIRDQLKEQIEAYGFIPPRAEKSKRVEGLAYRATVSVSSSTTVIDTEVAKIREACDESVFSVLFRTVTK